MKKKHIGVLFSGGLDSTYLLYKNLEEGHTVTPIYVKITNNDVKMKEEVDSLQKIFVKLFDRYGKRINPPEFVLEVGMYGSRPTISTPQIPLFVLAFAYGQGNNYDEYQVGYVQGDNAISYLNEIQELYSVLLKFQHWNHDKPPIPLTFPLKNIAKSEFFELIPSGIANEIWSCESPRWLKDKNIACGNCGPCKRNKMLFEEYSWLKARFPRLLNFYDEAIKEMEIKAYGEDGDLSKTCSE